MTEPGRKFEGVPSARMAGTAGTNEGARIRERRECKLGNYDVLFERWALDGSSASTLVFCNEDIAALRNRELEAFVRNALIVHQGSEVYIERSDTGFTFVSFNFES